MSRCEFKLLFSIRLFFPKPLNATVEEEIEVEAELHLSLKNRLIKTGLSKQTFLNQKIILNLKSDYFCNKRYHMVLDYKITEENNIQVLMLSGELIDKNQANDLVKQIDELLAEGKNKLIIDLSDLKYMNSSGLNVLIQLLTKTRTNGGESVIFNVSKKVNDLLVITKLNTLFKVADSKDAAINMLG